MTSVTNKEIAQAFVHAKKFLWDGAGGHIATAGKTRFICIAISKAHYSGLISRPQHEDARAEVLRHLQGCSTLEGWLQQNAVPCVNPNMRVDQEPEELRMRIQRHRLQWLDQLIASYSEGA